MEKKYDVVVSGGGLSGVAAAIGAAREGSSVIIIEKNSYLGGMATSGLVNPFMAYCVWTGNWEYDWSTIVNAGIFGEILFRLNEMGGLSDYITFNEELLKIVLDRMVKENGIEVLFNSTICEASKSQNTINHITIYNKSGFSKVCGDYFVDASGDADLAFLAGCEYEIGRKEDGLCQPMTLCFRIANIDISKVDEKLIQKKYLEFKEKKLIKNPREDVLIFSNMINGVLHFNTTRIVGKSPVDACDLSNSLIEAREQMYEMYKFLKDNIPGFEKSQLLMSANQIGVRESRRIIGEYYLTSKDLLSAKKFEDSVARGTYPIDIHNPSGSGTTLLNIPYGDYYTIPYRSLVAKGMDNLIIAGRPISADHEAHSAYRVMPICTSIGEGAGIAAGIAAKKKLSFRDVAYKEIQNILTKYNGKF